MFQWWCTVYSSDIRWQRLDNAPEPHEYAFIAPAPSWFDSQKMCKSMGGYLAEVTTKEEDDAIMAYIQDHQGILVKVKQQL